MADSEPQTRSVGRHDSQSTVGSLRLVDPAPIDSPEAERNTPLLQPDNDDDDDGVNSGGSRSRGDVKSGSTGAPGLSGSGRGAVYYLTRVQRYSSYAMTMFTSLHLCNVSLIPAVTGSVDASEASLLMTRELYQTSVTEPLLVGLPFVAHVGSGVALRLLRRRQNVRRYGTTRATARGTRSPWPQLSYVSMSGYVLVLFYGAHVFTNRVLPLLVEGDSSNIGLAYVAHGFARHPLVSWVAYAGLIGAGAWHAVWGTAKWLGVAPPTPAWLQPRRAGEGPAAVVDKDTRSRRRRRWAGVHGIALGVAALWAVGGLGVVARAGASGGWVGALYDDMFARVGL